MLAFGYYYKMITFFAKPDRIMLAITQLIAFSMLSACQPTIVETPFENGKELLSVIQVVLGTQFSANSRFELDKSLGVKSRFVHHTDSGNIYAISLRGINLPFPTDFEEVVEDNYYRRQRYTRILVRDLSKYVCVAHQDVVPLKSDYHDLSTPFSGLTYRLKGRRYGPSVFFDFTDLKSDCATSISLETNSIE